MPYNENEILKVIESAQMLYHRLILVVGIPGSGKTQAIRKVAKAFETNVWNINYELSKRLLDYSQKSRGRETSIILRELLDSSNKPVFFDNTEILFDKSLGQNPLLLLQGLSRNNTIVATWDGSVLGHNLTYAEPNHPEYQRYSTNNLIIISKG